MTTILANAQAKIEPNMRGRDKGILPESGIPALDIGRMSEAELDAALDKGYEDMLAGRAIPLAQAFAEIRRECGL